MSYIDGFVLPLPSGKEEEYQKMAETFAGKATKLGAIASVEGLGDGLEHGHTTDFYRAVQAKADENVVFSFIIDSTFSCNSVFTVRCGTPSALSFGSSNPTARSSAASATAGTDPGSSAFPGTSGCWGTRSGWWTSRPSARPCTGPAGSCSPRYRRSR